MTLEINKETLDYLRTELAESVRKSAEDTLFRFYRNAFAIIVSVLAAVGVTVGWPTFRAMVQSEISSQVKMEVAEPVAKAKDSADKLQEKINQLQTQVDGKISYINTLMSHMDALTVEAESNIRHVEAKITAEDLKFSALIESNQHAIEQLKAEGEELEKARVSRAQALDQQFASAGGFDVLLKQVAALGTQVQALDTGLKSLAADVGKSDTVPDTKQLTATIQTLQSAVAVQNQQQSKDEKKPTVFVQFAGGPRNNITALTAILKNGDAFTVPGEERLAAAAGKHEIRYYYQEDLDSANDLKAAVEDGMAQLKFPKQQITLVPLLSFAKKPQRGVIELWLEIPQA